MPQNAASDHGLHCLLTEISKENAEKKNENIHQLEIASAEW